MEGEGEGEGGEVWIRAKLRRIGRLGKRKEGRRSESEVWLMVKVKSVKGSLVSARAPKQSLLRNENTHTVVLTRCPLRS
jgi:hypothetical protein